MSYDRGKDPVNPVPAEDGIYYSDGLTIREYAAIKALQGLLADHEVNGSPPEVAAIAVKYADALLEELARPRQM